MLWLRAGIQHIAHHTNAIPLVGTTLAVYPQVDSPDSGQLKPLAAAVDCSLASAARALAGIQLDSPIAGVTNVREQLCTC